jgi:hypothetical protein
MTDMEDIGRRLGKIEKDLHALLEWMNRKIGAEEAEEKAAKRRAWIDRIASGTVVGLIVLGANWLVG